MLLVVAFAAALALASVGGGLYEFTVVDPFWPTRPDLIQPARGGISRKRFWIWIHLAVEAALFAAMFSAWSEPTVLKPLTVALVSHIMMRGWSAYDFIPKAVAFENADPTSISESQARAWVRRSRLRLPLDLITCGALLSAFAAAARVG